MAKNDWQKKFFKISMVLNVIIMEIFLTFNFFTNFGNRNLVLTIFYFVIFAIVIVSANFVLYKYYKYSEK
jgi:hypothetical protein